LKPLAGDGGAGTAPAGGARAARAWLPVPPALALAATLSVLAHGAALLVIAGGGPTEAARPGRVDTLAVTLAGVAAPVAAPAPATVPAPVAAIAPVVAAAPDNAAPEPGAGARGPAAPQALSRYDATALHNPAPPYPLAARRRGLEGRVIVRAHVTADGRCAGVELRASSGHALLDESVLATVPHWRFQPAARDGVAVASWVDIPVAFRLRD
jgi:protein TonB